MNDLSIVQPVAVDGPVGPLEKCWDDVQETDVHGRRPFRRRAGRREAQELPPQTTRARTVRPATLPAIPAVVPAELTQTALVPRFTPPSIGDDWQNLRFVSPGPRGHFLSGVPLVDFFRADPAARAFDVLRTQLLQTLRSNGWTRVAIASPTHGCGSTFTAVNLTLSLARIPGSRTVLIDLNHRTPGVAGALDLAAMGDMRGFLSGEVAMNRHLVRTSDTLALGLTAGPDADAAELLHDARTADTLDQMTAALNPDVVLYDLPPVLEHDDLAAFLPQVDGVLLVADGTRTVANQIAKCKRMLEGQTQVLGVILNRARSRGLGDYGR